MSNTLKPKETYYQYRLRLPKSLRKIYVDKLRECNLQYNSPLRDVDKMFSVFRDSLHSRPVERVFWANINYFIENDMELPEMLSHENMDDYSRKLHMIWGNSGKF